MTGSSRAGTAVRACDAALGSALAELLTDVRQLLALDRHAGSGATIVPRSAPAVVDGSP